MKILKHTPLFLFILIIHNILAFSGAGNPETGGVFNSVVFRFNLISGAMIPFTVNTLLLVVAFHLLYFDILKATRLSASSMIGNTLSMIVFIVFLVEFIVVKQTGTPTFFLLTCLSLLDVIAGFTVSLSSARRDIVMER